jgi:hypothetical protein
MTGQAGKKAGKIMFAYFDYIGEQHLENICRGLEAREEEINQVRISDRLDGWFNQYIEKYKKKEAFHKLLHKFKTVSARVSAILFVVIASMVIVTVSVDAIRLKVLNLLVESNDKYLSIRVEESASASIDWKDYYYPAWIPEGFRIKDAKELNNIKIVEFTDDRDQYIVFTQAANGTEIQLNTEGGKQREVVINHQTAILSEKPGMSTMFWNNDETSFCLSSGLNGDVLVQIAQSVKKK